MKKHPVWWLLAFSPPHVALARLVSYGGMSEISFWDEYRTLCAEHGQERMSAAVGDILVVDKTTCPALVRLSTEARKLCWQLLGPQPEHPSYDDYWKSRTKPANHQPPSLPLASEASKIPAASIPPAPEPDVPPPAAPAPAAEPTPGPIPKGVTPEHAAANLRGSVPTRVLNVLHGARVAIAEGKDVEAQRVWAEAAEAELRRQGVAVPPEGTVPDHLQEQEEEPPLRPTTEGISLEGYARMAKEKNRRALLCMLRDARKKLAHHGRRSFMGKEAKKEIAAAEAEIDNRGYSIPEPGQETKEWEKTKK